MFFISLVTPSLSNVHHLKINNIVKWANSVNNRDRKMECGLLDGGEDGEYNGVHSVETSQRSAMLDVFFSGTAPFDIKVFLTCKSVIPC